MDIRIARLLIFTALFIAVGIVLHPPSGERREDRADGISPLMRPGKLDFGPDFDIIAAGDSRIDRGVVSSELSAALGGAQVFNFGFDRIGWSDAYLDRIERLLNPKGTKRYIVLGVSPLSLTVSASEDNEFMSLMSSNPREHRLTSFVTKSFPTASEKLLPYDLDELNRIIRRRPRQEAGLSQIVLQTFVKWFAESPVSEVVLARLERRIAKWRSMGIGVYTLRTPTCQEMETLENRKGGYKEDVIAERMTKAGAVWIPLSKVGWHTVDGSHLDPAGGHRLTQEIAQFILKK